jgi:hypothetical protein
LSVSKLRKSPTTRNSKKRKGNRKVEIREKLNEQGVMNDGICTQIKAFGNVERFRMPFIFIEIKTYLP